MTMRHPGVVWRHAIPYQLLVPSQNGRRVLLAIAPPADCRSRNFSLLLFDLRFYRSSAKDALELLWTYQYVGCKYTYSI